MLKKYYTIDDLYQFCKTNNFSKFSSKDSGGPLIVQQNGLFSAQQEDNSLLHVQLKSCHTGKNRNKSGISDETMSKYKDTFKGKPILGAIYKTDTGEYEFRSHDVEFVENENGEQEIEYIEQPVGVISEIDEPYLEYDENEKKNYLIVNGNIFSNYSHAAEILQRRKTCKCSVEIAVEEMSYNCVEDYLSIDSFEFLGVTILGYEQDGVTEIQEGMKGSKISIEDFSTKNSMNYDKYHDELIETLDKINMTLEGFNKNFNKEGGEFEMHVEDVEKISTEEDVVMTEELVEKVVDDDDVISDSDADIIDDVANFEKTFTIEISHEDIRYGLYNLIGSFDEEDNDYYCITNVFDNYFLMRGYFNNKIYKIGYEVDNEDVKLVGDRQEMFELILTESEKNAIEDMRKNYSALSEECNVLREFKNNTEAAALKAQKDAIFNNEKYNSIRNTNAFKKIIENSENCSIEECENNAEEIFNDFSNYISNFSANVFEEKQDIFKFSDSKNVKDKNKPYGNLFDEK